MASTKLVNSFSLDYTNGNRGKGTLAFSIHEGSVIQANAEAIISVLGGGSTGGLSEAIIKAAGSAVCDEIVANKARKLTENIVTKAGNLKCKYIIHCNCPKWNDYDGGSKRVCLDDLYITVKKALVAACDKGLKSVALPPIGLGNPFGIPKIACSAMYVKAIKEFVEFLPGMKSKLKEIQFFDKSSEMTQLVYNTYQMTNGAGERYLSHESVLMRACQSPASTTQTSHHNRSHSTNPSFNHGQHAQHFQTPYGQAGNYQPPPLTYPSSSNSWSQSNIPAAAPSCVQPTPLKYPTSSNSWPQSNIPAAAPPYVPSNWTYIGNVSGADTFNINQIQVLIYTGELPKLNNVDILVSTENSRVPGNGKLAKAIFQKAGKEYQKEHAKLFSGKKKINNGEILQTGAGLLHFKVVLHAIIDKFPNASPTPYHLNELYQTTLNLLDTANKKVKKKQLLTIALPLLGAGAVSDPRHQKEYASVLLQGIASFSSASKVKLWAVHIVSLKPETTKLLVEVCQSFCSTPNSQRRRQDSHRGRRDKKPNEEKTHTTRKTPKFTPSDSKFIESWKALRQSKQKIDSFFEAIPTPTQGTLQKEESVTGNGNLVMIDSDSEDETPDVYEPDEGASAASNNHSTCIICMDDELTEPVRMKLCKHEFCRECITEYLSQKPACPVCNMVYGEMYGDQPVDGVAKIYKDEDPLPGYTCGTLIIHYEFPHGRQTKDHPNPEEPYRGLSRQGYLPDNKEGRQILRMLKRAFEHRLVFTVGFSRTSGRDNVVTWNDIHHKTRRVGGPEQYGYPDPEYLARVKDELGAKGISED